MQWQPIKLGAFAALAIPFVAGAQVAAPDGLIRGTYSESPRTISLSWQDNSNNETQFNIEKSTDGGASWEAMGQVGSGTTTFSGTLPTGFFCFRVLATDGTIVSNPSNIISVEGTDPAIADTDEDGMNDASEVAQGLDPYFDDALEDMDGDRYPNIFEFVHGTDIDDIESVPVPDLIVDGSASLSGNIRTTIQAALDEVSPDYGIIQIKDGVFTGSGNVSLTVSATHKVLLLSENGARKTIVDGGGATRLISSAGESVIDGLTLRNGLADDGGAIQVSSGNLSVINCVFTGNQAIQKGGALYQAGGDTLVVHSTFINNQAGAEGSSIYVEAGNLAIGKSILWNTSSASEVATSGTGASLEVSDSIVRGGFTGTGNLNVDPLVRVDGHLINGSPAIDSGGTLMTSLYDMDGEVRPVGSTTDLGADEWMDTDSDNLPDWWELQRFGSLEASGLGDGEGLANLQRYITGDDLPGNSSGGETIGDGSGQGRVIYVNGTIGDDNKSGEQPNRTALDGPKKTVNGAIEEAQAGDRIVLEGGAYPEAMSFQFPGEGRVIIEATEKVTLGVPTGQTTNQPINE